MFYSCSFLVYASLGVHKFRTTGSLYKHTPSIIQYGEDGGMCLLCRRLMLYAYAYFRIMYSQVVPSFRR